MTTHIAPPEPETPVFSASTRKIIYIICLILSIASGCMTIIATSTGAPTWVSLLGSCLSLTGGSLGSGFGVRYAGISQ